MDPQLSRRQIVAGMPIVASAAMLTPVAAQASGGPGANDLADPQRRARARARIMGSCGQETTFLFYRLNIYGFAGDGNLIPFFTMNNLAISEWTPLADGTFHSKSCEADVYCRFDTDETIDDWTNPLTGAARKIWHFKGGPFEVTIGADGIVTKGAELHPATLRMERLGDIVFVPTAASAAYPNPASPEKWPKLSSGKTIFWESQATFAAKAEDAFNERLTSAPAFCHFQNLPSWAPWMAMAGRPGRTYGNAHGAKLHSLDQIPLAARKGLDSRTPEIFDWKNWTTPRNDVVEFLATQPPE